MILVDKDIIERSKEIFINGYDEENVKPISYDIHIADIITEHGNVAEYDLKPQQAVMVKCIEEINVPTDLLIRVENKNSLIRKGITFDHRYIIQDTKRLSILGWRIFLLIYLRYLRIFLLLN